MKRWMKRSIIIFTMNWWAKFCPPTVSIICLLFLITSCKKEGDFNLGASPNANVGVQFTDTLTLVNQTFLLNDSIISSLPAFMSFGAYSDPGVTGFTYAEAYATLNLTSSNIDYTERRTTSCKRFLRSLINPKRGINIRTSRPRSCMACGNLRNILPTSEYCKKGLISLAT